jgi:Mg-chelatase subunit ChlD
MRLEGTLNTRHSMEDAVDVLFGAHSRAPAGRGSRVVLAAAAASLAALLAFAAFRARGESAARAERPELPPRQGLVVFVVDLSASMQIRDVRRGEEPVSRLEAAIRELAGTLSGLRERGEFFFDVVACSSRVEVLSRALGKEGPLPLDAAGEEAAARFLREVRGGGMTRMPEAVQEAFEICRRAEKVLQPGTLLLYTDGIPTYGRSASGPRTNEEFLSWVRNHNPSGIKVNAFALSPTLEGTAFLERLCEETHGILFVP